MNGNLEPEVNERKKGLPVLRFRLRYLLRSSGPDR